MVRSCLVKDILTSQRSGYRDARVEEGTSVSNRARLAAKMTTALEKPL